MNTKQFGQLLVCSLSLGLVLFLAFSAFGGASAQESALPEGFHDGMEGIANAAGCTAFGWAVDPDDRDRDLQVQILADDNPDPATTTTADLLRQDVTACPGGTCGFGVSLWGLISAGQQHQITAQAYDEETGTWVNLEATPKSLTCWGYPEGFHDGAQGLVDRYSCNANGWAVDPDDRDRDLQVRIFSDGEQVTSTIASNYREDMDALGICPGGTCAWFADLWGLIPLDQEHQITAQAYDEETGAWLDLEATPKSLTCQTPPPPNPRIIAFPENDAVEGWEWPEGATVYLTVDNAPGFMLEGTSAVTTWGDPRTYIRFDFASLYDLQVGDVVTLTDNVSERTHTVQNLSVTAVDPDADVVTGAANTGVAVYVWPHGYDQIATLEVTAGDGGAWLADFGAVGFNLVPGIGGRSEVRDEAGSSTAVDWNVPMLGWQQVNPSGFGDPQTSGVTSLEVFRGQLYAGVSNWNAGGQIWRLEEDGQWQQVAQNGFGSGPSAPAIVDLAIFQGQLYAGVGWNAAPGQVWRSADGINWQPVTTDGFGDGGNIVVSNFAVFRDMLFAGTGSNSGSAQIWRSKSGESGSWTQVAPDNGPGVSGNVAGFAVYKGVLYAAIEPSGPGAPAQVWRSTNGSDWTVVITGGFGDPGNVSTGGFAQFGGYLYLGTRNDATGGQIWRTMDGLYWEMVTGDGFGDLDNIKVESLLAYDDLLYAVTYNQQMGIQVWRSADGMDWEQVSANGFGDSNNFSTLWNNATAEYQGNLLIGTWNNAEGGELWMYSP